MSNYQDLSLYLVTEGEVTAADPETEWDGANSILVAATSEDAALKGGEAYDRGEVQAGNLQWLGQAISVVCLRDRETGDYL